MIPSYPIDDRGVIHNGHNKLLQFFHSIKLNDTPFWGDWVCGNKHNRFDLVKVDDPFQQMKFHQKLEISPSSTKGLMSLVWQAKLFIRNPNNSILKVFGFCSFEIKSDQKPHADSHFK